MRLTRSLVAASLLAALLLTGCSKPAAETTTPKRPLNVSSKPETLLPAPNGMTADTRDWTELPAPIAKAFGATVDKGKFQAFAAMKETTIQVRLKQAPDERAVFAALDAAAAMTPEDYSIALNVYAPGKDGKDRFSGWEWEPLAGNLTAKTSADADQGWDSAITAVTAGSASDVTAGLVKSIAAGSAAPPLLK